MRREEQDALILYWWMRGKSAAEIATIVFGNARMRNVVIGRVTRARGPAAEAAKAAHSANMVQRSAPEYEVVGFTNRTRKTAAKAAAQPKPNLAPSTGTAEVSPLAVPLKPKCQPIECSAVTIVDMTESLCHWPIGGPVNDFDGFRYCGAGKLPVTPYCLEHTLLGLSPEGQARFRRKYRAT